MIGVETIGGGLPRTISGLMVEVAITMLSLTVAVLRVVLPSHGFNQDDMFKDAAHLWVGGLIGAALSSKRWRYWTMAIGLSVVEVAAAIIKG